ncbi:MAG: M14 family zinc carboxypeptidase [Candidatus Hodarchaeales archaeon]
MSKTLKLSTLIITFLFLVAPLISMNSKVFEISQTSDFEFLWDSLKDAPGYIEGDDVLFWGSDLGPYYNYLELTESLHQMNNTFPDIVDLSSIGKSCLGKELWMIKLTDESVQTNKHGFFIIAHHHARETITVMNALYILNRFISDYKSENTSISNFNTRSDFTYYTGTKTVPDIESLLNSTEIYILPSLNPDGLDVIHINPWQRKNLCEYDDDFDGNSSNNLRIKDIDQDGFISRDYQNGILALEGGVTDFPGGVDLNRNYDYRFIGSGSSPDMKDETYRGPNPFSEPETQAVRDWTLQHQYELNYAMSLHSGVAAVIGPWGYTSGIDNELSSLNIILDDGLSSITGYPNWDLVGGYRVNGEWADWTYGFANISAFTIETYGNTSSYQGVKGIWDYFNPNANEILWRSEGIYKAAYFLASSPSIETNPLQKITNFIGKIIDSKTVYLSWNISDSNNDLDSNKTYTSKIFVKKKADNQWKQIFSTNELSKITPLNDIENNDLIRIVVENEDNKSVYSTYEIYSIFPEISRENSNSVYIPTPTSSLEVFPGLILGVLAVLILKSGRKKF